MRRRIFLVVSLVAALVLLFSAYAGYVFWDISNLKSACGALKPGTTIAEARQILSDHRFRQDFTNGIPGNSPGTWYLAIAAASTMGDVSCGITYDGTAILSAEVSEW